MYNKIFKVENCIKYTLYKIQNHKSYTRHEFKNNIRDYKQYWLRSYIQWGDELYLYE